MESLLYFDRVSGVTVAYKNYLIFDFGSSNVRSVVARFEGKKIIMDVIRRSKNTPVYVTGTLYWDILRLYNELKIGIRSSVNKYKDITSLAVDTWGIDFSFIDKSGKLISNPVNYRDNERIINSESLFKIISKKEIFKLSGFWVTPILDLFHMYSLKKRSAPDLLSGYKYLAIPDLLNYFITGETLNEYTRATTTLMFNQVDKKWETNILDKIGIVKELFCRIVMPGSRIGNMAKDVCKELEINPLPVIASATHDTASAVAGIPAMIEEKGKWAFVSMGSWFIMGQESEYPNLSDDVYQYGFANEGGVEESNIIFKNINGLWIIQQCRESWEKDYCRDISWDEIVEMSIQAKQFKSFINVDDPIFGMPQIKMPEVIRRYCYKKSKVLLYTIGDIARCVYESLAMRIKYNLNLLEKITPKRIKFLHLVGGGIQNELLCQWIADATGLQVLAGPIEATAVGNFITQLKASGEINTLDEGRLISEASFKVIHYKPREKDIWDYAYNEYLKTMGEDWEF